MALLMLYYIHLFHKLVHLPTKGTVRSNLIFAVYKAFLRPVEHSLKLILSYSFKGLVKITYAELKCLPFQNI